MVLLFLDGFSNFFKNLPFLALLNYLCCIPPPLRQRLRGGREAARSWLSCLLGLELLSASLDISSGPEIGTPGSSRLLHLKEQTSVNGLYLTDTHCSYSGFSFCPSILGILVA